MKGSTGGGNEEEATVEREEAAAQRMEDAEGGMILLSDFWESPGGLNELFIAWNMALK